MAPESVSIVQGRPASEVPYTLDQAPPKVLSFWDQSAFWANLGVSLLAFTGAYTVLAPVDGKPGLSIEAGIAAMIVGTVIGGLMLGLSAVPGARTGAPAMVLLRGLFGTRLSYLPTALNIAQLVGWGTFELITIAGAANEVFAAGPAWLHAPRWLFVLAAGLLTTLLTIWPLGSVRLLRRFVTVAVVISLGYFYVQFLRQGLPDLGQGSWNRFWVGVDAALAVSISWVPLAADYTRHSRSTRAAFGAASVAYSVTQIVAYVLGLFALALATTSDPYTPFLHVALGAVFLGVFVLREVDQSFANVYSTAVSIQNLFPRWDRRILTIVLGALITGAALLLKDMNGYFGFLGLIGSVFVPMLGVLVADFFLLGRGRDWNLNRSAPSRWGMIAAWLIGFAAYQLIHPSDIGWWSGGWVRIQSWLHFTPADWMSASLLSFAVSVLTACAIGGLARRRHRA
ncbi:MAG: nucleobase:cation symporter, family [Streptosporangiaceae bacterium]|nr:cytosine/purines uracil thiamine allantoin permease [Streptosporangiaceae bacterium]MDX6430287.1 nucleobase:cation symporter, family [Streptosporangiaceae bacterium]